MKPERSPAERSLRAVSIVISLVSIVAFSTLAYSVYADYEGVVGVFGGGQGASPVASNTVVSGSDVTQMLNFTVPNKGLYPITVSLSCSGAASAKVTCTNATATVPPGSSGVLAFAITLHNATSGAASLPSVPGTLALSISPFATLRLSFDFASLGGAQQ